MDQLKVYLKLAAKYRFWIAFGISLLLPVIGFVVGAGAIETETTKREAEIKSAKADIEKYRTPGIVNNQYQPLAASKKDVLVSEVDATWRKLFASQEPLLKWPASVEVRFRGWGRKYPAEIDKNQVQSTIIDYTVAYPEFVEKIYTIFKPFNFDDGSGIVVAPDSKTLLAPAPFSQNEPPDLTKIWAEQERLWVITALLDSIAKVNDSVGAKEWDAAIIKQILLMDVGSTLDQDQKSVAKGDQLVSAEAIVDPSAPPAAAAAAPPASSPGGGPGMVDMGGGGAGKSRDVMYLKTDTPQYKILPIKLSVLVDQARLADFLVGLENSPMAIEVSEVEISKPSTPVAKPAYGERSSFNFNSMGPGGGDGPMMGNRGRAGAMAGGGMGVRSAGAGYPGAAGGGGGGAGYPGAAGGGDPRAGGFGGSPKASGGVDNRSKNEAKERKDREKRDKEAAAKSKGETKKLDQYYNVIEATVYGRARFYMAPPPAPVTPPSTAEAAPPPPPTTPTPEAAPNPAPTPETPKAEAPKAEAPKAEAPAPAPGDAAKGDNSSAKAPADPAPKNDTNPAAPKP